MPSSSIKSESCGEEASRTVGKPAAMDGRHARLSRRRELSPRNFSHTPPHPFIVALSTTVSVRSMPNALPGSSIDSCGAGEGKGTMWTIAREEWDNRGSQERMRPTMHPNP